VSVCVQDGMFHPPMVSGGGRVAPSPSTSAHEEHDSTSNLSWPSTPVCCACTIVSHLYYFTIIKHILWVGRTFLYKLLLTQPDKTGRRIEPVSTDEGL